MTMREADPMNPAVIHNGMILRSSGTVDHPDMFTANFTDIDNVIGS